ncbi:MAG: hypothetical protein ACI9YB_003065, partial [Halioglobus sp.]
MTEITLGELEQYLIQGIKDYEGTRPFVQAIMQLQYDTGLRASECLDTSRWLDDGGNQFDVALDKGNGVRTIDHREVPNMLLEMYIKNISFFPINYNSYNYAVKRAIPSLTVDHHKNKTTSHIFRYR